MTLKLKTKECPDCPSGSLEVIKSRDGMKFIRICKGCFFRESRRVGFDEELNPDDWEEDVKIDEKR